MLCSMQAQAEAYPTITLNPSRFCGCASDARPPAALTARPGARRRRLPEALPDAGHHARAERDRGGRQHRRDLVLVQLRALPPPPVRPASRTAPPPLRLRAGWRGKRALTLAMQWRQRRKGGRGLGRQAGARPGAHARGRRVVSVACAAQGPIHFLSYDSEVPYDVGTAQHACAPPPPFPLLQRCGASAAGSCVRTASSAPQETRLVTDTRQSCTQLSCASCQRASPTRSLTRPHACCCARRFIAADLAAVDRKITPWVVVRAHALRRSPLACMVCLPPGL